MMGKDGTTAWARPTRWLPVVLIAALVAGVSVAVLTVFPFPSAFWPTSGLVAAAMLWMRAPRRPALVVASGVAIGLAAIVCGLPFASAATLALANMVELSLVAIVLHRVAADRSIPDPPRLGLLALACLAASALAGVSVTLVMSPSHWAATFASWTFGHALMLLIALSLALALGERPRADDHGRPVEAALMTLLMAAATVLVFLSKLPQLSFLMPLLLVAAVRLAPRQAILVAAVAGGVAAVMTGLGHGPIAAANLSSDQKILLLLVFVAVTLGLTLPVSLISRDRRDLEIRLRATARQFRLLAEASPGGVIHYDLSGRVQFMNARWSELTGTALEEVERDGWQIVLPASERARALAWWNRTRVEDTDATQTMPCRIRNHEGWADIYILAERESDGTLVGWVVKLLDATDRVEASRQLNEALDEAKAATKAKSDFLATMSHEIRTPMTGVLGMIELLDDNLSLAERRSYLATLKRSADLLMAVINDVLDFSKLEHAPPRLECRDIDLASLVSAAVDLFANAASQKGLLVDYRVDSDIPTLAHGDPVRLQQVISNLVSNAIKFTDTGTVTITLGRAGANPTGGGHRWRVEVRDTGIGISPSDRAALFQPFVQAQDGNMRRFGGTGLGLAISRKLVDAMGGQIGVDPNADEGSTFWFEVPLADATGAGVLPTGQIAAQGPAVRALRVLVAEDNAVNQLLVTTLLRRAGHDPTCVANGQEAVDAFAAAEFDCVLMDMQMPVMDGIGATRAIRKMGDAGILVPIFALTADASPERRRFYDQAGLTDFLTKPIDSVRLNARLADVAAELEAFDHKSRAAAGLLDEAYLDTLLSSLGPVRLSGLVDLFLSELDHRPDQIAGSISEGNFAAASSLAHSLKGAALSAGARALANAALVIEAWRDDPGEVAACDAVRHLHEIAAATRLALEGRLAGPDALHASA